MGIYFYHSKLFVDLGRWVKPSTNHYVYSNRDMNSCTFSVKTTCPKSETVCIYVENKNAAKMLNHLFPYNFFYLLLPFS
jgi:hypothetical protein